MRVEETGKLISELRREKGLTQKQLAEQLGLSDRTISKWERGAGFPDVSLLTRLADALGCSVTELLTGTRSVQANEEQSVREAVLACCQQTKRQVRRNAAKIIEVTAALIVLLGAGGFAIHKLGEDRVLVPPEITSETILDESGTSGELLLKNALTGVYHRTCRYAIKPYEKVRAISRNEWQSYVDTIPNDLYKKLKSLSEQKLLQVQQSETGNLCSYAEVTGGQKGERYTIVETDAQGTPVFEYQFDLRSLDKEAYLASYVTADQLSILFRNENAASSSASWLVIDKATGTEKEYEFTYAQLSGNPQSTESLMDILFDSGQGWVEGHIFYFAATRYCKGSNAIIGAYDLERQKSLSFTEFKDAEIMNVHRENRIIQALVNHKYYTSLNLYSMELNTGAISRNVSLELPYEYLADREVMIEDYYLGVSELNASMVTVLFEGNADLQGEKRKYILTGYEPDSGEMLYRSRLSVDTRFEIYGIENFAPDQT